MLTRFEERWAEWNAIPSLGMSSWAGGALAALEFAGVRGETVLCPSNTFMATPLAAIKAGAEVEFVDCNRTDLCMSFSDFEAKAERLRPRAAILVHIGGHIAFDTERIAAYCRDHGIFLLEDCAHAHGADWNGKRPGTCGDAGVYSLYATKTVSTGEGGVLVSADADLVEFARKLPQLRQVRSRRRRPQLPHERVHGCARPGPGGADGGDRRVEEQLRPRAPRPSAPGPAGAPRANDLGPLQVHRLRGGRDAPPAASTSSPATGSWAATPTCPTPSGSRRTTGACRIYYRPASREAALQAA